MRAHLKGHKALCPLRGLMPYIIRRGTRKQHISESILGLANSLESGESNSLAGDVNNAELLRIIEALKCNKQAVAVAKSGIIRSNVAFISQLISICRHNCI